MIAAIVERTDGVLVIEEVTRAALESGGDSVPQVRLPGHGRRTGDVIPASPTARLERARRDRPAGGASRRGDGS